jgi:RNA polymerase sigma factor (sigma-70 family)
MGRGARVSDGQTVVEDTVRIIRRRLPPGADVDALLSDAGWGLIQALRGFDPRRGVPFRAYAIRRVRGEIFDGLRRRRRRRIPPGESPPVHPDRSGGAGLPRGAEARELIAQLLGCLPRRHRLVLQLSYLEQMPLKQIGHCFGLTEAAICIIRKNALGRLRKFTVSGSQEMLDPPAHTSSNKPPATTKNQPRDGTATSRPVVDCRKR